MISGEIFWPVLLFSSYGVKHNKLYYVALLLSTLNPEGFYDCHIGLKVMTILKDQADFAKCSGGDVSGRVCNCYLRDYPAKFIKRNFWIHNILSKTLIGGPQPTLVLELCICPHNVDMPQYKNTPNQTKSSVNINKSRPFLQLPSVVIHLHTSRMLRFFLLSTFE